MMPVGSSRPAAPLWLAEGRVGFAGFGRRKAAGPLEKLLPTTALLLLLALFDILFGPAIRVFTPVAPSIALAVTALAGMRFGGRDGAILGFVTGLFIDLVGGGLLGVMAGGLCLAGYVAGALSRGLVSWGAIPVVIIIPAAAAAELAGIAVLGGIAGGSPIGEFTSPPFLIRYIVIEALLGLCILPFTSLLGLRE